MRAVPRAKSGRAISHNRLYGMRWTFPSLVQISYGPDTTLNTKLKMKLSRASLYMARFLNPTAFRPSDNLDQG